MKPPVAIIIPCHNAMPHIKACIEALIESTKFPFQLIIVESESTDGTAEYVDTLKSELAEVYHTKKKGLPAAINFGIKKAGKLDVYLTQADVIHFKLYGRDWLLEMYEAAQNDNIGIVTSIFGGGISGEEYLKKHRWVGTWSTYLPRSTIDKVGLFDENMGPGDDIDYCYRIGKAKLQGRVVPFWVQHHRLTDHGNVDNPEKIKEMGDYFRKKHGLDKNE